MAVLTRLVSPENRAAQRSLLFAYRDDDPALTSDPHRGSIYFGTALLAMMFASERGFASPAAVVANVIQQSRQFNNPPTLASAHVAQAVASRDPNTLADAIDTAEEAGLVPHAARMRIVLAAATRSREPLLRARPVLERLRDRQFLLRLDEVAASLD